MRTYVPWRTICMSSRRTRFPSWDSEYNGWKFIAKCCIDQSQELLHTIASSSYPLVNLQKTMERPFYSWVNPLFRLGHFPVRKLLVYQRVSLILIPGRNRAYINMSRRQEILVVARASLSSESKVKSIINNHYIWVNSGQLPSSKLT